MKKVVVLFVLFTFSLLCVWAQSKKESTNKVLENVIIHFPTNGKNLTIEHVVALSEIVYKTGGQVNFCIKISAHADKRADSEYNKKLSAERAASVMQFFLDRNIDAKNIVVESFGESCPMVEGDSRMSLRANRRVEVKLTIPVAKMQHKAIEQGAERWIFGDQGTVLHILSDIFEHEDGTFPQDSIYITLKEYYKKSDMILAGLSTYSNNLMLETGGMLHIAAHAGGKSLKIRDGKRMNIYFPFKQKTDEMMVFNGIHNRHGVINWIADEASNPYMFEGLNNSGIPLIYTEPHLPRLYQSKLINLAYRICRPYRYKRRLTALHNRIKKEDYAKWLKNCEKQLRMYKEQKAKEEAFENAMRLAPDSIIRNIESGDLISHIRSTSKLGWINCDKFSSYSPEKLFTYRVKVDNTNNTYKVMLVFKNANSILIGQDDGEHYVFKNVPLDEQVVVVAVKDQGDTPELAMKDVILNDVVLNDLKFDKLTFSKLKQKLEILN